MLTLLLTLFALVLGCYFLVGIGYAIHLRRETWGLPVGEKFRFILLCLLFWWVLLVSEEVIDNTTSRKGHDYKKRG